MNLGVHQGSVLSPLLFIMVLDVSSQKFRTWCPWELLYTYNLVIIAESVEKLCQKLTSLKVNIDNKGLRVNMKKTKVMVSDQNMKCIETFMKYLLDSGMWPYCVWSGVCSNSIFCSVCKHWILKKCIRFHGRLVENVSLRCVSCYSLARPIAGRPRNSILLGAQ